MVAFLFVAASLTDMVGEYLFMQKTRQEEQTAEGLAADITKPLYEKDAQGLFDLLTQLARQTGARLLVTDQYGVVQSDTLCEYNGQRLAWNEIAGTLATGNVLYGYYSMSETGEGTGSAVLRSGKQGGDVLGIYVVPLHSSLSDMIGTLVYISDSTDIYKNLSSIQHQMRTCLVLVAFAVLLLSLFVSRIFTKPMQELEKGIGRMAQGDLSTRISMRGSNEFAQLAQAFNTMSEKLETLDKSRNQFVSDASHELKTPLSAMRILSESLLYEQNADPAMAKEFLSDIVSEVDRLTSIVNDLLTLVHIDSGRTQLRTVRVMLDELVSTTAHRLSPVAQNKNIRLECVAHDKIECLCDDRRLEQVFYNLIDNTIKYTPEGGSVRVDVARIGHTARISVADSGVGIPKSAQAHIFDRFYRVDKARTRSANNAGGTGLGLSIVRQFVLLHGGTITLESEEEKGSTFTVELPIINI